MGLFSSMNSLLEASIGPLWPAIIFGMLGILVIVLAVAFYFLRPQDPFEKLQQRSSSPKVTESKNLLRQQSANAHLERFSGFLEPKDVTEYTHRQMEMRRAGYTSKDAVRYFHLAQMVMAILGLLGGLFYVNVILAQNSQIISSQKTMLYTVLPGCIGYYFPKYWITRRVAERKNQITQGFPDALDMMLICVEAGQSLDQSIVRVSEELHHAFPFLAEEFELVAHEIKAGKDKDTVLQDMSKRCGVNDISSFTTVLIQSSKFGTSISDALRVYAREMRDKRIMRAEEAANKLPTKMTLATMLFTVPPLLLILVSPSIIKAITMFSKITGN